MYLSCALTNTRESSTNNLANNWSPVGSPWTLTSPYFCSNETRGCVPIAKSIGVRGKSCLIDLLSLKDPNILPLNNDFELPPYPLLSLGIGFTLYSILTASLVYFNEQKVNLEDEYIIAHIEWVPATIGFSVLGLQAGVLITPDIRLILSIGILGYSLAALVYLFLKPYMIK